MQPLARLFPLLLLTLSCAGKPQLLRLYTPFYEDLLFAEALVKLEKLGYVVRQADRPSTILAVKPSSGRFKQLVTTEEISVAIKRRDDGRATVLSVTPARVIPATGKTPERRVAASGRTMEDGRTILNIFLR